ncbi:cadherin domain-containing protein [Candidatus Poriferisodalis sp.]|uniref:cadherin domain-containing protein n=1 Tax=Candidatus Poriferisodalis sp. TaxID=3101277 RepID=UPI003B012DB5
MNTSVQRDAPAPCRPRSGLIVAVVMLALTGVTAPIQHAPAPAQSVTCSSGAAVGNPSDSTSLVADCETLLGLKSTLAGSGRLNWSASRAMTEWDGITISGGRVTEIQLSGRGLTGSIPAGIGDLSGLVAVYMAANELRGSIPSSIGNLSRLRHLDLSLNELRRPLPSRMRNLSNLETLDLANNFFLQALPSWIGNLTSLRKLGMSGTGLLGHIPSQLGNLSHLEELRLTGNRHFGFIPSQLGSLSHLRVLYLSSNNLYGAIPSALGNLPKLTGLGLSNNRLSGDVPIGLEELRDLEELKLADNDGLTGCVPGSLSYVRRHDLDRLNLPYCRAIPIFRTTESGERSVRENSAVSTAVGAPFVAVDRDGDRLTYSLGGADAANFLLDASTGQLRTATTLDHESQESHSVTVSVHDGTDRDENADTSIDTTIEVTVTITDADEAPTVSGPESAFSPETADIVLGHYSAADPEDAQIAWAVGGTDRQAFRIDRQGALRFVIPPDYESPSDSGRDNTYDLTVQASDDANTVSLPVTVTVTAVEEAPVLLGPRAASLDENRSGEIGRYRATDPEGLEVSLTLGGPDSDSLTLSDEGVLSLDTAPDYEQHDDANQDGVYEVTVDASDGTLRKSRQVRIAVRDVNEALIVTGATEIEREETHTDTYSVIGYYRADDPESSDVEWSVAGTDSRCFTIDGAGYLRFAETPDFEYAQDSNRDNTYMLSVQAFDGDNKASLDVSVRITNVDEQPELRPSGLYPQVGTSLYIKVADPDGRLTDAVWTWERSPNRSTWSPISSATSGSYSPTTVDTGRYLRASVSYTDPEGDSKSAQYTWSSPARAQPSGNVAPYFADVAEAQRSVPANATAGTAVGFPITAEDDDGDPLTYSLSGISHDTFRIDAASGQIRTSGPLDHTTSYRFRLTVSATDPSGQRVQRPVTVSVSNEADAPAIVGPRVVHVDEGSSHTAYYRASDPDLGSQHSWDVSGTDADDFRISAHGRLLFRAWPNANSPADANLDNIYQVDVEVSDGTFTVTRGVRIIVADLDEAGIVTLSQTQPQPGTVLRATLSDPDGSVSNLRWEWQRRRSGDAWTPIADTSSHFYTVSRADSGYALRAEVVYDDAQGPVKSAASDAGAAAPPIQRRTVITPQQSAALDPTGVTDTGDGGSGVGGGNGNGIDGVGGGNGNGIDGVGGGNGNGIDGVGGTTLFIANGWNPPDIGVAATLAARTAGAAVAYTEGDNLPPAVQGLLDIRTVHLIGIVGGEAAVSDAVRDSLAASEPFADIKRFGGATRIETSIHAARLSLDGVRPGSPVLIVANGWSLPDIGVAATLAARMPRSAVVFTSTDELSAGMRRLIAQASPGRIFVIGGTAAIGETVEGQLSAAAPDAAIERVSGATRVHTALLAAQHPEQHSAPMPSSERVVIVANGWNPHDIGIAAVLSAHTPGSVVMYTAPDSLPPETADLIEAMEPGLVRVIGGTHAVPDAVVSEIAALLPAGTTVRRSGGADRIRISVSVARSILPRD